jgi:hypothetical protein
VHERLAFRATLVVALVLSISGCGGGERNSPAAAGHVGFRDAAMGVAGEYPQGWHRVRALTNLVLPREVLALATYPLRGGDRAGECAPASAREDMPPDGAFVWLLEYRPPRGEVWADLSRSRFPPRRIPFELRRADLQAGVSCFAGPALSTTFSAADRPFQLLVAFGKRAPDERLAQVRAVLDSLRFEPLPAPPPDPYAGWPLVNDNPGDSLRPPPGWPSATAMFRPGGTPRPRPLFFASNLPLPGLPQKPVPYVDELPGPFPHAALDAFPATGVLVWVLEEDKAAPSPGYPPIDRDWPSRADFHELPTKVAPELRWLRAGGSYRGYRFSVWIAAGARASARDVALAIESVTSLAVSGCWRDGVHDCPD